MAMSFQKYYQKFSNKAISFNEILECNDKDTRKQQKRHINIETKMTDKRKFFIFNYNNSNNNNKYKI